MKLLTLALIFAVLAPAEMSLANPKGCPPGLAKMNPPCVPPGHATRPARGGQEWVGQRLDPSGFVYVEDLRRYGLPVLPAGRRYAVVDGNIVVIDAKSYQVLQWINLVNALIK